MQMMEKGVPREKLVGSYAGATGYPQFSAVGLSARRARCRRRRFRLISAASHGRRARLSPGYFQRAGWRKGEPWGFAVSVPAAFDRNVVKDARSMRRGARVCSSGTAKWLSMAEWRAIGVAPVNSSAWPDDRMMATLLEPDGPGRTA